MNLLLNNGLGVDFNFSANNGHYFVKLSHVTCCSLDDKDSITPVSANVS